jgi:prefoldin subunit 5
MNGFRLTLGCMIAVVCATAFMTFSATAEAQVRVIERDTDGFTVRIESGARLRHLERAIGMEPDMDLIARSNPGHIIYVCYDNLPGERPYMSRDPEAWDACQHFPRERWLLAGVTYYVPLRFESAPGASDAPSAESLWREEGLRSRNRLLERRVTELETELETVDEALAETSDRADEAEASSALLRDRNARLERDMAGMSWLTALFFLLFLLMGFAALYTLWRTRLMLRRIMDSVRRERSAWSLYADKMRRNRDEIIGTLTSKVSSLNGQIEMLKRSIIEASNELAQTQTWLGRLRRRTNLLLTSSGVCQRRQHTVNTFQYSSRQWMMRVSN